MRSTTTPQWLHSKRLDFFGLSRESVHFIVQGLVPAVDYEGKILLAEKGKIAMTPDGHGGSLRALVRSGAVDTMKSQGIDIVSYFQVDNPIVQCMTLPLSVSTCSASRALKKMVPKAYALEKVGHFCIQNVICLLSNTAICQMRCRKKPKSTEAFVSTAVAFAIHIFDRDFIARAGGSGEGLKLPFHRADKKIPYVNAAGKIIQPQSPNGVKFEMFVFDALPLAKNPVIIEAARGDDFSPVKNAKGVDSPQSSKEDQLRMFARWLKAAVIVSRQMVRTTAIKFEISPRFAADEADFVSQWATLNRKPKSKTVQ